MAVTLGSLQTEDGGEGTRQSVTQAGTNSQTVERLEGVPGAGPERPSAPQWLPGGQEQGPGGWACFWGWPGCPVRACC